MQYSLLTYALKEAGTHGVNSTTIYGWVGEFGKKNDYSLLVSGKSGYETDHGPTFVEFKEYLAGKIENYAPHKKRVPLLTEQIEQTAPSEVSSSLDEIRKLEVSVKALRKMGYIVSCSYQTPAREL